MVYTLDAIVRHLTVVLVWALVGVLMIAEIWQVYLLHQAVKILRTKFDILIWIVFQTQVFSLVVCHLGGLLYNLINAHRHKIEVKQSPSVLQGVVVATMLYIMLSSLGLIFAPLDFEFAQVDVLYYLRDTLLLIL